MVGNNTPTFFMRTPLSSRTSSLAEAPARTGLRSNNMQWDYWSLSPESLHQVIILISDRGTPRTWRHMNGYSSHTYMWINAAGQRVWVSTLQDRAGHPELTAAEAKAMKAEDPDYHRRDLYQAIKRKEAPAWRLEMQIMPFEDAATYRFNPFDLTKVWPHRDYPPITIGPSSSTTTPKLLPEIEQAAFSPANMVPGTGPSPDKMLLARLFSYHDTHLHRIGTNYEQLPVNRPRSEVHSSTKTARCAHAQRQPAGLCAEQLRRSAGRPTRYADPSWFVEAGKSYQRLRMHAEDNDFIRRATSTAA